MREITLEDQDIKNLIVYDTSGFYSDHNYNHSYEKGLKSIRSSWLTNRKGINETPKTRDYNFENYTRLMNQARDELKGMTRENIGIKKNE